MFDLNVFGQILLSDVRYSDQNDSIAKKDWRALVYATYFSVPPIKTEQIQTEGMDTRRYTPA